MATRQTAWYGNRVTAAIRVEMGRRLDRAGEALVDGIAENISTAYPPASLPGGFPHRRTGELIDGLYFKTSKSALTCIIGNAAPHAVYLELGTANMEPRPHGMRTAIEMMPTLRRILLGQFVASRLGGTVPLPAAA